MRDFTGILSIISNQSSLNSDLLLMAGIPDTAQAMFAATQFLVKTRRLNSGQPITVSGEKVRGVGIIVMHDAIAASPRPFAEPVFGAARSVESLSVNVAEDSAVDLTERGSRKTRKNSDKTVKPDSRKPVQSRQTDDSEA